MNRNIKIALITLLITIAVIGGTYAYYVWTTSSGEETKISTSLGAATIYLDGGGDINQANLKPTATKEEGIVKNIKIKGSVSNKLSFNLYFDIIELGENLNEESFKFALYKGSTLIKEGNFSDEYINNNTVTCNIDSTKKHVVLLENELISTSITTYTLYVWVDGTMNNPSTMMKNQSYKFSLHADGQNAIIREGKIPDITQTTTNSLAYNIVSNYLNSTKTDASNNGIVYHLDTDHNLISDIAGNVRYYGANPNNYIYFNCDDYSNQTSSTCEVWRIIGVFDGKIKLIRNSVIGNYSWDTSASTVNSGNGYNQWGENGDYKGANLMKLLNPGYSDNTDLNSSGTSIKVNNSLYYNAGSGTCYNGESNATTTCNFTTTGLKNDQTRNLISKTLYYLGGYSRRTSPYSDQMYEYERGTNLGDNPYAFSTWEGYIALPYASDYGYAADFNSCTQSLYSYNNTSCTSTNWMKSIFSSSYNWLLPPIPGGSSYAQIVWSSGEEGTSFVSNAIGVAPVLYLESNANIDGATTGTSDNPYKLTVN